VRDSFPEGPTTTPHIESTLSSLPCRPATLPLPGLLGMRIAVTCIHSGTRSWQPAQQAQDRFAPALAGRRLLVDAFHVGDFLPLFFCDRRAFLSWPVACRSKHNGHLTTQRRY
jgi:hypothetical protein